MDPFSVASAGFGIASGIAGMFGSKKKKKAARKIRVEQQNQAYLQKDSMELNRIGQISLVWLTSKDKLKSERVRCLMLLVILERVS